MDLALDRNSDLHNGGCDNCRSVVTIHQDATADYDVEYYIIRYLASPSSLPHIGLSQTGFIRNGIGLVLFA